jgi:hypothetical protein
MGIRRRLAALMTVAAPLALLPATAQAQEPTSRFGERDELAVTFERLFGFQNQKFSDEGGSYESTGFHPFYWAGLGLFSVGSSGLSFGALLGFTRFQLDMGDGELTANVIQLRPRVGYAGTEKSGRFGYWLRLGPTLLASFAKDEDVDSNGQKTSDSSEAWALAVGGEAYAVFFPAPHVGVLFGPHADFHLAGGGDGEPYYRSHGLSLGLMGEFH